MTDDELRRLALETALGEWRDSAFVSHTDLAASLYDFARRLVPAPHDGPGLDLDAIEARLGAMSGINVASSDEQKTLALANVMGAVMDIPALCREVRDLRNVVRDQREESALYERGWREGAAATRACAAALALGAVTQPGYSVERLAAVMPELPLPAPPARG